MPDHSRKKLKDRALEMANALDQEFSLREECGDDTAQIKEISELIKNLVSEIDSLETKNELHNQRP